MVILDTSIWSEFLRKGQPNAHVIGVVEHLLDSDEVVLIGPIRQEILSGIAHFEKFEELRLKLRAFRDLPLQPEDYELAAELFNRCRRSGIQGSNTDFLICAVAVREGASIYTVDQDFQRYQTHVPIRLHAHATEG